MKNRYIPFGYQIQNGDSVINTEQAATVQHIFYAYTEGQSFKEIAEYLTTSGTAYHFSDNSWNKNIVARILANEIYCGAKGYPAIISKEVYSQAASIRSNKTVTYKLRKLSGKIKILKANIAESTDGKGEDEEATKQLTAQDLLIKEYDDILTARIIEKVIVHSRQEIEIYFIGGYTQKIDLI